MHVLRSGCRWCDCPPEYGPPTTIYNRFVRWAGRGIWENLFRELAGNGRATGTQMIELHAHQSAPLGRRRKRGEQKQAVGRSRGGRNTKIYALADAKGRLIAILLTGGEAHDCPVADRLICRSNHQNTCSATRPTTAPNCAASSMSVAANRLFRTKATERTVQLQQPPLQAALAHRECF